MARVRRKMHARERTAVTAVPDIPIIGEPVVRPLHTPLYDRVSLDFLRQAVRHNTAYEFLGWSRGVAASTLIDIIGRTKDGFFAFSDGTGIGTKRPEAIYEWFERVNGTHRPYNPKYIDALRYFGPLINSRGHDC